MEIQDQRLNYTTEKVVNRNSGISPTDMYSKGLSKA
jgi:hypothetical protein